MGVRLLIVRPLRGTVGEVRRVSHIVDFPEDGSVPARLQARCGESFGPNQLELLVSVRGMPCESCMRNSPPMTFDGLPRGGEPPC